MHSSANSPEWKFVLLAWFHRPEPSADNLVKPTLSSDLRNNAREPFDKRVIPGPITLIKAITVVFLLIFMTLNDQNGNGRKSSRNDRFCKKKLCQKQSMALDEKVSLNRRRSKRHLANRFSASCLMLQL
jgi:hypothetical protein